MKKKEMQQQSNSQQKQYKCRPTSPTKYQSCYDNCGNQIWRGRGSSDVPRNLMIYSLIIHPKSLHAKVVSTMIEMPLR